MRKGILRRQKKERFFANAKDILAFRKRQFEGEAEPEGSPFLPSEGYKPDKDPNETNHQRVVRQRKERDERKKNTAPNAKRSTG